MALIIKKYFGIRIFPWFLFILLFFCSFRLIKDSPEISKILSRFEAYTANYPQQKVYLHTDKDVYYVKENIWIKAYVVNAMDHKPDTLSSNLYIDLVSPHNRTFNRLMLKIEKGFAHGDIALTMDSIPEGNYQLKAYTNWMKNFDEGYTFVKTITIKNPNYQKYLERDKFIENKRINRKIRKDSKDILLHFFPEGGTLLNRVRNRIAFKAMDGLGKGVEVKGVVVDSKNHEITRVESIHTGMGAFYITPEKGIKYYFVTESFGHKQKYQLPAPSDRGMGMMIDNISDQENILISMYTNEKVGYNEVANKIILIGQMRNKVFYANGDFLPIEGLQMKVPKSLFPTGIAQLTLFNNLMEPVCERLLFIDHKDYLRREIRITKEESEKEGFTRYSIKTINEERKPVKANLSISVRGNDNLIIQSSRDNILSSLLLTSDIPGYIEDPWYYFSEQKDAAVALDYILMTHGWRRFVWKEILNDQVPEIQFPVEHGITITGKITRSHLDIPINGSKVTLYILNEYNDFFTCVTSDKGKYIFSGLEYYDTIDAKIEARTPEGMKNLLIYLDETDAPDTYRSNQEVLLARQDKKSMVIPNYKRTEIKKDYDVSSIHGEADFVLDLDKINVDGYSNLFQVIDGRVPGVDVMGSNIVIRGPNSFYADQSPLVVLDGIPTDISILGSINPKDVRIIEILKGPSTAIYGFRGGNGVIAVYTRRGQFMKRGEISFQMLGYYRAREFYRPFIEVYKNDKIQRIKSPTIFWEPQLVTDSLGDAYFYLKEDELEPEMNVIIEGISYTGEIIYENSIIVE